jgi:His-Xaa-Ser repeat protein HxsA
MKWHERVALLLGVASPAALGLVGGTAKADSAPEALEGARPSIEKDLLVFRDPAERARLLLYAGHSSHASHASHSSHYSGSGGSYVPALPDATPAPSYTPPAYTPPAPATAPAPAPAPASATPAKRLTDAEIERMVTKVQLGLITRGYDPGPVDGTMNDKTKDALRKFQRANGLTVTGYMDLQTLRLLGAVS